MPLAVELKRDVPFILNGAMLKLPPKASAKANRLGIVDAAELVRRGQTVNLKAGRQPIWVHLEPRQIFSINGADAALENAQLRIFNPSHLITAHHRISGLPPQSAAFRLYRAVWDLAVLPQAGPFASADNRIRTRAAYDDAVTQFRSGRKGSPFLDEVDGLVRKGNLQKALLCFRMVTPGKRARAVRGLMAAE